MMESSSVSYEELPEEMKLKIFRFLDPKSLCSSIQVNKSWNRIGSEENLWKQLCLQINSNLSDEVSSKHSKITIDWKGFFTKSSQFPTVPKQIHRQWQHLFNSYQLILMSICLLLALTGFIGIAKQHYILATFIPTSALITNSEIIQIKEPDGGPSFSPSITYFYECDMFDIHYVEADFPNEIDLFVTEGNETLVYSSEIFPLSPLTVSYGEEEYAESVIKEYPKGQLAVIYRDPVDCSDSFLLRQTDGSVYLLGLVPLIVFCLMYYYVILIKKPNVLNINEISCIKQYDHEHGQWLYLPIQLNRIDTSDMLKINIGFSLLITLGIFSFIHYFVYGEHEDFLASKIMYPVVLGLSFFVLALSIWQTINIYQLHSSFSTVQILQQNPFLFLGSPSTIYIRVSVLKSLKIIISKLVLTRFRTIEKVNDDGSFTIISTKTMFSRSFPILQSHSANIGETFSLLTQVNLPTTQFPTTMERNKMDDVKFYKDNWTLRVVMEMEKLPRFSKEIPVFVKTLE